MKTLNKSRLEKICGKDLNVFQKQALDEMAKEFEATVRSEIKREQEHQYNDKLLETINHFLVAISYTLHFNEKTKFGAKRLNDFLNDIQATVDMFGAGEYSAVEYEQILLDEGIKINVLLD